MRARPALAPRLDVRRDRRARRRRLGAPIAGEPAADHRRPHHDLPEPPNPESRVPESRSGPVPNPCRVPPQPDLVGSSRRWASAPAITRRRGCASAALQTIDLPGRVRASTSAPDPACWRIAAASLLRRARRWASTTIRTRFNRAHENLALNPAIRQRHLRASTIWRASGSRTADVVTANLTGALLVRGAGRSRECPPGAGR